MATVIGAAITYGVQGLTYTAAANCSGLSEALKYEAESKEAIDMNGNTVSVAFSNFKKTYEIKAYLVPTNGTVPPMPEPGTVCAIVAKNGGDPEVAGNWHVLSASKDFSNTEFAQISISLGRWAGI